MESVIYKFEDIGDDLPRPPLAAMRALFGSGMTLSARAWSSLDKERRWQIARLGTKATIDSDAVQQSLRGVAATEVRLVPRLAPPPKEIPEELERALGEQVRVTQEDWVGLRPLD